MSRSTPETQKRKSKKARLSHEKFDITVCLKVGKQQKEFIIHKTLLCNAAAEFKKNFDQYAKDDMNISVSEALKVDQDDPETFRWFTRWLYADQILQQEETTDDVTWSTLISLYLFSHNHGIPALQNHVIDILIDKKYQAVGFPSNQLNIVYEHMKYGAPLRRLFIDWAAFTETMEDETWINEEKEENIPKTFLMDVIRAQYQMKSRYSHPNVDFRKCRDHYHVKMTDVNGEKKVPVDVGDDSVEIGEEGSY
ncbi:hypothetical protein ACLMJK_003524 [Lecanora helva]